MGNGGGKRDLLGMKDEILLKIVECCLRWLKNQMSAAWAGMKIGTGTIHKSV